MTHRFPCPVATIFSRRVRPGFEERYEEWMSGIVRATSAFPGSQGTTVLRPSASRPEYLAIVQFDAACNLERWMESEERAEWLGKLEDITLESEEISSMTGMERWFTLPDRAVSQAPPKHKMAVVIFLGIYPLIMLIGALLQPLVGTWPLAPRILASLVVTIPLMTWIVMPLLTRLFFGWLYPEPA